MIERLNEIAMYNYLPSILSSILPMDVGLFILFFIFSFSKYEQS